MEEGKGKGKGKGKEFTLIIPLDASLVKDRESAQNVKVVAKDREGIIHAATTEIGDSGKSKIKIRLPNQPGPLHLAIGPGDAEAEELLGLQTLTVDVATRKWAKERSLELEPVLISSYYWFWWLRWCRTFVIRGKVVCPDGKPVPGAEVCIFDVDRFFIWHSTQQLGCVTTGIDGTFEYKFRWCCGWWPWWWWRRRVWALDDLLVRRIGDVINQRSDLKLSRIDNQPSLAVFDEILGERTTTAKSLKPADVKNLPSIRDRLIKELPSAAELNVQRIWPWYPWWPWWDCHPDIIFKVTQDCEQPNEVILEENVDDTRWNIPHTLDVTLAVNDNACCVAEECPNPPCDELECLIVDRVCGHLFSNVGGNQGAPGPVGYLNPGPVPINSISHHRPFGGVIPIHKNPEYFAGVDYYEIQVFDDDPMVLDWVELPGGAAVNFGRRYWDFTSSPHSKPAQFNFQDISGHNVVETRSHFEINHPLKWPSEPGPGITTAVWLSQNYSLLLQLDTTKFADGTYRFRVVGWQESGGVLTNEQVLPVCGTNDENEFQLTFDNRTITAPAAHDASHHCNEGVHLCTTEPDTHILAVRFNGENVVPCDTVAHKPGTMVEIDFLAHDANQHLAYYELESSWGLSQSRNLLEQPGASVTPLVAGTPTGWAAGQNRGNYGTAVSQGAPVPHWSGGQYRLTLPLEQAFPVPCCYQLELRAYKRTIVGYGGGCHGYWVPVNGNRTEYSLGVGVCP